MTESVIYGLNIAEPALSKDIQTILIG